MVQAPERDALAPPPRSVFWNWVWDSTRPVVGWGCIVLGLFALLIGWFGVSGESIVEKQLPYLVSGGFAGLALVMLGSRFLIIEDLRRDGGRLDRLETMVMELHAALLSRSDAPDRSDAPTSSNGHHGFLALPGGSTYHLAGCVMLAGKHQAVPISASLADERGLSPCPLCEPAAVSA